VTNAHVVAGEKDISVDGANASVIYFNAQSDLAVLHVASRSQTPLRFLDTRVVDGTKAQVVGFPLNSTRSASPAYIDGFVAGEGRDIYDAGLLTRTFEVVETNVQPGNSGSPVLVNGRVAGIIESKAVGQASTAYAIPNTVIENDLARVSSTIPVSTQGCVP
jgi:S1-C subfamily serine protease